MGEATYYLKATWKEPPPAETRQLILDTMRQACGAYEYWQKHRYKPPWEFWPGFKFNYPLVCEHLIPGLVEGDCNNALAGDLSYGGIETDLDIDLMFPPGSDTMTYMQLVWHFADWSPLCKFLSETCGADTVRYLSDEHTSLFDLL